MRLCVKNKNLPKIIESTCSNFQNLRLVLDTTLAGFKTKTVLIMHYGISTVTLKNLWSELVGYCQSPPFSNVSLPYTL